MSRKTFSPHSAQACLLVADQLAVPTKRRSSIASPKTFDSEQPFESEENVLYFFTALYAAERTKQVITEEEEVEMLTKYGVGRYVKLSPCLDSG